MGSCNVETWIDEFVYEVTTPEGDVFLLDKKELIRFSNFVLMDENDSRYFDEM